MQSKHLFADQIFVVRKWWTKCAIPHSFTERKVCAPKIPERLVKSFKRWTNMLWQVPMSIISLCWYACCCFEPTCHTWASHYRGLVIQQWQIKTAFSASHTGMVGYIKKMWKRLLILATSKLCSVSQVSRQISYDQGGSYWTMFITESTHTHTI